MKNIILYIIFSLLFISCNKDKSVTNYSSPKIEVRGQVLEKTLDGILPSINTRVQFKLQNIVYDTLTNEEGRFNYSFTDSIESLIIQIDKSNFTKIDTQIFIQENSYLNLYITEIVNYFPLAIGTKWKYKVDYYVGDSFSRNYQGMEVWEIISMSEDSTSFKMNISFTGKLIYYEFGAPADTIYYENFLTAMGFIIKNDNLFKLSCDSHDRRLPLLDAFFTDATSYCCHSGFGFNIFHPVDSIEINIHESCDPHDPYVYLDYKLQLNKGITDIKANLGVPYLGWNVRYSYDLISHEK